MLGPHALAAQGRRRHIALKHTQARVPTPQDGVEAILALVRGESPEEPSKLIQATADFFGASIANPHTRKTYRHALIRFLDWAVVHGFTTLHDIRPSHVGAFLRYLEPRYEIRTVKLTLVAVREYFRHLVNADILSLNPARETKSPRQSYREGETPTIPLEDARRLLAAIPVEIDGKPNLIGLRDRALIAVMLFAFARVGAALKLDVRDVIREDDLTVLRLKEKGGKPHKVPCNPALLGYLAPYLAALSLRGAFQPGLPLFRPFVRGSTSKLTTRRLSYQSAYLIVQQCAKRIGLDFHITNHSFRALGITTFVGNGGLVENARDLANHASTETTKLYVRKRKIDAAEMERVKL